MVRGLEILEMRYEGDYWKVKTALHGRKAVDWEFPKEYKEKFPTEDAFELFLARHTQSLLDAFGDARECRLEADPQFVV